jgi:hypothetical protein
MGPVRRADNLTTFMCQLSSNLGASNSWNPQGLSRPVMGLLYLYDNFALGVELKSRIDPYLTFYSRYCSNEMLQV